MNRYEYELTKEAMLDIYAPETRYLPPAYERALIKQAGIGGMLSGLGTKAMGAMRGIGNSAKGLATNLGNKVDNFGMGIAKSGIKNHNATKMQIGSGIHSLGQAMAKNPGATAAIGAAGLGGAGLYAANKMRG